MKFVLRVTIRVLGVLFAPVIWLYGVSGIERRGFYKRREQLLEELRAAAPFLFDVYRARVLERETNEVFAFDGTILTLCFETFFLRVSRCRGDLNVGFCFDLAERHYIEVAEVLSSLEREPVDVVFSLSQLAEILEPIMPALVDYRNRSSSHGSPRM